MLIFVAAACQQDNGQSNGHHPVNALKKPVLCLLVGKWHCFQLLKDAQLKSRIRNLTVGQLYILPFASLSQIKFLLGAGTIFPSSRKWETSHIKNRTESRIGEVLFWEFCLWLGRSRMCYGRGLGKHFSARWVKSRSRVPQCVTHLPFPKWRKTTKDPLSVSSCFEPPVISLSLSFVLSCSLFPTLFMTVENMPLIMGTKNSARCVEINWGGQNINFPLLNWKPYLYNW